MIKEFVENVRISACFMVNSATKGMTNSGQPYYNITLQDSSGQIEARKWDVNEFDHELLVPGQVVFVVADPIKYRNVMQLKVISISGPTEDVDLSAFMNSAPISKEELKQRFFDYVKVIKNTEIKQIVDEAIKPRITSIIVFPAASKNHHEYVSGLIHHIVSMLDLASSICRLYPSLNKDLLYAGIILHDLGKTVELTGPVVPRYTTEGRLLGHISIMQAEVKAIADKLNITSEVPTLLQHMILSHHGQLDYGSPVLPLIKEAEILAMIDNMDARMNMMEKALEEIKEGEFTSRIFSLDDRCFYKPLVK